MMKSVLILDEFFAMTAKIRTLFLSHIKITNYLTPKHGTFNLRPICFALPRSLSVTDRLTVW